MTTSLALPVRFRLTVRWVLQETVDGLDDHVDVGLRRRRQAAAESHLMVGVSQPLRRQADNWPSLFGHDRGNVEILQIIFGVVDHLVTLARSQVHGVPAVTSNSLSSISILPLPETK